MLPFVYQVAGGLTDFEKGWPTKKILGFTWSKKAIETITLETISFGQNIYISVFSLTDSSKFSKALIRKEKKSLMQQSMRKEKLRKVGLSFTTACFT